MLFISHALLGVLLLRILSEISLDYSMSFTLILISVTFAMLPDLDSFYKTKLKDHHKSYFHAPLFWLVVLIVFFALDVSFAILVTIQIMAHLLTDYLTARTAGIALLYPFSKKEYSLFKLTPKYGDFYIFDTERLIKYLRYYVTFTGLSIFEIVICILGIVTMFY